MNKHTPGIQHPYRKQLRATGGSEDTPHPFRWVVPSFNFINREINPSLKDGDQNKLCLIENTGLIYRLVQTYPPVWDFVFKLDVNTVPAIVKAIDDIQFLMETKADLLEFNLMVEAIHKINNDITAFLRRDQVVNNLGSNSPSSALSAQQGRILKGMIDDINHLLGAGEGTITNLQEIVQFMNMNRDLIENLTIDSILGLRSELNLRLRASDLFPVYTAIENLDNNKVGLDKIADNLETGIQGYVLSANQGKKLSNRLHAIETLLLSDDTDLDSLQEIVEYIKQNREILDSLTINSIYGLRDELNRLDSLIAGNRVQIEGLDSFTEELYQSIEEVKNRASSLEANVTGVILNITEIEDNINKNRVDIETTDNHVRLLTARVSETESLSSLNRDALSDLKNIVDEDRENTATSISDLLSTVINPLDTRVVELTSDVDKIKQDLSNIGDVSGGLNELLGAIEQNNDKVYALTYEVTSNKENISSLQDDVSAIGLKTSEIENTVNVKMGLMTVAVDEIEKEFEAIKSSISTTSQTLDNHIMTSGVRVKTIEDDLDMVRNNVSLLTSSNADVLEDVAKNKADIANISSVLNSAVITVENNKTSLENLYSQVDNNRLAVDGVNSNLSSYISLQNNVVSEINGRVLEMEDSVNEQKQSVDNVLARMADVLINVGEINQLVSETVTENRRLADDIAGVVSVTEQTIENVNASIANIVDEELPGIVLRVSENDDNIIETNRRLNLLTNRVSSNESKITNLQSSLSAVSDRVDKNEIDIKSNKDLIDSNVLEINETLSVLNSTLTAKITDNKSAIEQNKILFDNHLADYVLLKDRYDVTESNLLSLSSDVENIGYNLGSLSESHSIALERIDSLVDANNSTLTIANKNKADIYTIQDELESQSIRSEEINERVTLTKDRVSDVERDILAIKDEVQTNKNDLGELSDTVDTEKSRVDDIANELEAIPTILGRLDVIDQELAKEPEPTIASGYKLDMVSVANGVIDMTSGGQAFKVDATAPVNISFNKPDLTDKITTITIKITGSSTINWPSDIVWVEEKEPELGDVFTIVVIAFYENTAIAHKHIAI